MILIEHIRCLEGIYKILLDSSLDRYSVAYSFPIQGFVETSQLDKWILKCRNLLDLSLKYTAETELRKSIHYKSVWE
jgi:hypothetical protein